MKTLYPSRARLLSAFLMTTLVGTCVAFSQIIYSDTFTGTGALNGSAPTIASGTDGGSVANWSANTNWTLNGTEASVTAASKAHAYLPFSPVLGTTYTLSLNVSTTAGSWVAFGFLTNLTGVTANTGGDSTGAWQVTGAPAPNSAMWQLFTPTAGIQAFGGIGQLNQVITGSPAITGVQGGLYSITIQNTSAGNYNYSFSGPGITGAAANQFSVDLGANSIVGVGFGLPQGSTSGTIDNFTLTAIPEPSTYVLLLAGSCFAVVAYRRKCKQA